VRITERDQLILEHMPQVKYIAHRLSAKLPSHVELGELVSAGTLGVLDAAEKFDPSRGIKFKTYAETKIRGSILDSLRNLDWAPRSLRKEEKNLDKITQELCGTLSREPTEKEICDKLEITQDKLFKIIQGGDNSRWVSLEEYIDRIKEKEQRNRLKNEPVDPRLSPLRLCELAEKKRILSWAISKLSKRDQQIVSLYYYDELTMNEIGKVLGLNESRISQCHAAAIRKIGKWIRNRDYIGRLAGSSTFATKEQNNQPQPRVIGARGLISRVVAQLEKEIVCDTRDLLILKQALAICQKST